MPFENHPLDPEAGSVRPPESFHSRYDPLKEAARHVESCLGGKKPSLVFILGGGVNYIGKVLLGNHPYARLVLLQPSDIFDAFEICQPAFRWSPSSHASLDDIVRASLQDEYHSGGISIIEWNPVMKAYPGQGEHIRQSLRLALEMASTESATSSFWSYRWLRNSMRYAMNASRLAHLTPGTSPIVIACAGPGLSAFYSRLHEIRGRISLWSLASASLALRAHGLEPDLVIATDPGFWNGYHLHSSVGTTTPIAFPPSAYVPPAILEDSILMPLDTGLSFERIAMQSIGSEALPADASGSSAGTALSLAITATSGPIFIIGLDLAALGSDDHARPYAFDVFDRAASHRTAPEYSLRILRIVEAYTILLPPWRTSRPFSAYAQTIKVPKQHAGRVFRCGDSPVMLDIQKSGLSDGAFDARHGCAIGFSFSGQSMDTDTRTRRLIEGFSAAIGSASSEARQAIKDHRPMHHSTALLYRALAGKHAAETIANTARACANDHNVDMLDCIARSKLLEVVSR
jgi:hypothetical protein